MRKQIGMSLLFISLVFSLTLLQTCGEQKIEVLPNLDEEYAAYTDEAAEMILSNEEFDSLYLSLSDQGVSIPEFAAHLYLNKKGIIEKAKIQGFNKKGELTGLDKEQNKSVLTLLDEILFVPAVLNEEPSASQLVLLVKKDTSENTMVYKVGSLKKNRDFALTVKFLKGLHGGNNDEVYFVAVENMPMPIGGIQAIADKIVYPEVAKELGIEGKVFVKAYINEEGTVDKAEVLKGIGSGCDEAALDAVTQTKFEPGRQNGVPVKVQISIPVVFRLN